MSGSAVDSLEEYVVRRGDGWVEVSFDKVTLDRGIPQVSEGPLVSVNVTTYQHERYIAQTLDSIISQQTEFLFEIIVGEDGSRDETRKICLEYAPVPALDTLDSARPYESH